MTSFLSSLPAIEWVAVLTALVYVVLAARNSVWCWPFAFASSLLWAWQVWFSYSLLFDAGLNVFYAVMAVVGYWQWHKTDNLEQAAAPISSLAFRQNLRYLVSGITLSLGVGWLAHHYTSADWPYLDALTTTFSVLATFMLIQRKIDSWIYLLVVDVIYVYLYYQKGSLLFAGLFVLYCVLAVYGFLSWLKIKEASAQQTSN